MCLELPLRVVVTYVLRVHERLDTDNDRMIHINYEQFMQVCAVYLGLLDFENLIQFCW
jgi:hypothetical protein